MHITRLVRSLNAIHKNRVSQIVLPFTSHIREETVGFAQVVELGRRSLMDSGQHVPHQES